ncbi:MAG: 6-bladed beta-propeller [Candidatus Aminicenantes bacterium]|nr:6-bladed beta-propeller [Candidatus Aminicenantes bacterium]
MKRKYAVTAWVLSFVILSITGCGKKPDEKVQIVEIEGIRHVMNPSSPLKGTILLNLEKTLEIDPYEHEEVGLKVVRYRRDTDGEIIMFDPNLAEAHRFNSAGEYLGNLIRAGQGPGEFTKFQGLTAHYMNDQIWATSLFKVAGFDKQGNLLEDKKLPLGAFHVIDVLVDDSHYIALNAKSGDEGQMRSIILVDFSGEKRREQVVYYSTIQEWLITDSVKMFTSDFPSVTPEILYAFNKTTNSVAVGLNMEYKITIKNLQGQTQYVIERPMEHVHLSIEDKKKMIKWDPDIEFKKWQLSVHPDNMAAIQEINALPSGYLAVSRITGPGETEVDVFDPDGKYIYILKTEKGVSLDGAEFYDFGFGKLEERNDLYIYVEYRIKNLPEIFINN